MISLIKKWKKFNSLNSKQKQVMLSIKKGDLVMDLGANVGTYSEFFRLKYEIIQVPFNLQL